MWLRTWKIKNECLGAPEVMSLGLATFPSAHDSCHLEMPVCSGSSFHGHYTPSWPWTFRHCEIQLLASVSEKELRDPV